MVGQTGYVHDPELTKRNTGLALLFMTEVLGYTHEQAWRLVRPSSKATGHSAVSLVTRFIRWYRDNHPLTVMQALEVNGISIETLVKSMKGMLFATKTGVERLRQRSVRGFRRPGPQTARRGVRPNHAPDRHR